MVITVSLEPSSCPREQSSQVNGGADPIAQTRIIPPHPLFNPKANSSCAGWTYSKSEFKKGDRDCYLRDSWGAMANNCNDCYSAPRNHSAI